MCDTKNRWLVGDELIQQRRTEYQEAVEQAKRLALEFLGDGPAASTELYKFLFRHVANDNERVISEAMLQLVRGATIKMDADRTMRLANDTRVCSTDTKRPLPIADLHQLLELLEQFHGYALEYEPGIYPRSFIGNSNTLQSYVQDAIRHRQARAGQGQPAQEKEQS